MEKPVGIYKFMMLLFVFPILAFALSISGFIVQDYFSAISILVVGLFFGGLGFFYRKWIFLRVLINDDGIKEFYGKKVLTDTKWEEIVKARIDSPDGRWQIFFTKTDNTEIKIMLYSRWEQAVLKYKHKIPVPITELETLPKVWREKFQ